MTIKTSTNTSSLPMLAQMGNNGPTSLMVARRAIAEHIDAFQWDHVVGLDTRRSNSPETLKGLFHDRFLRLLSRRTKKAIKWFIVIERGATGRFHIHALLYGTSTLDMKIIESAWRQRRSTEPAKKHLKGASLGRVDVKAYDPKGGAPNYMAKQVGDEHIWWDMSAKLPPKRS